MGHRFRQTFLNCAEASYFRNQRLKRFPALTRKKYESITERQLTQLTVSNLARLLIFTGRRTENQDLYHIWFQDSNLPIHLRSLKHTSLKALGLRFNKKKDKKKSSQPPCWECHPQRSTAVRQLQPWPQRRLSSRSSSCVDFAERWTVWAGSAKQVCKTCTSEKP